MQSIKLVRETREGVTLFYISEKQVVIMSLTLGLFVSLGRRESPRCSNTAFDDHQSCKCDGNSMTLRGCKLKHELCRGSSSKQHENTDRSRVAWRAQEREERVCEDLSEGGWR